IRLDALEQRSERLDQAAGRLRHELTETEHAEARLVAAVDDAEAQRAAAERIAAEADTARGHAEGERLAWAARADALTLALDGPGAVPELPGALGVLSELLEIDSGWQAAVEAALAGSLTAVVVHDVETGRRILED